ncbi:MAG: ribonuclease catalytic domain-containing protein, partial [Actinomycetota bacterium]|nr:ribonuclease catalytic domain-containing protein [Actinomycetota bacterium]
MTPRRARAAERRVAVISKRGRFLVGESLFERDGERISLGGGRKVRPGALALLEVAGGRGKVLEDLGRPDRAADVIKALLRDQGMGRGFPRRVEEEAEVAATAAAGVARGRRDLTDLPTFTVDPASARDFDDAVSAARSGDGVKLWIHIADVAAHVRPGSVLEKEAYGRATSTYVPGTVEPMLPFALSSSACSLAPGVERLAVTAEIELNDRGEARSARFYRSTIRSDVRLDYEQLDAIFAARGSAPEVVAEPLALARQLAATLARKRAGSSLEVKSTEPDFEFDADGRVVAARAVEQTESHELIEQLMVLTNEQVAELLERKRVPTLYRVHEQPDPERIARLIEQFAALEIPAPPLPKHLAPSQAGHIAVEASRAAAREAGRRGHGR